MVTFYILTYLQILFLPYNLLPPFVSLIYWRALLLLLMFLLLEVKDFLTLQTFIRNWRKFLVTHIQIINI